MNGKFNQMDTKELEFPETVFVRDIEGRVFQAIALQCLSRIEGVALLEGTLIDSFLGRDGPDRIKGVSVEQDQKNHSVNLKVEVNVLYGLPLPKKAEEIQTSIVEEVSKLTGLHVGRVHVVFKNLMTAHQMVEEVEDQEPRQIEEVTAAEFTEEL
jgi:uncharacterized alkaline shock family protein YloU